MDKNAIKKYAVWARNELIARVTQKAEQYEITEEETTPKDADSIGGKLLTEAVKNQRKALIEKIETDGYEQVMEEVAYTWFNRFTALRFMEVNNYLPSHTRVFTNENGEFKPQILADAISLDLEGLDMDKVFELKDANKTEELYKYLLITQCNALSSVLPRMFQKIEHYTELLLPDYLLREGSVIEQMIALIPEEDWTDQVQIIGWLYQYYNSERKDEVFAALKKRVKISKENIPAATQLFTPDWIVRYMVENSLGRLWLEGHPNDTLKSEWKYYLDEAEQEPDVQRQLDEIRKEYAALKPEEIRCIDPCMGSGHILCYMFDVLVKIYEDYGYTAREAAGNIVEKNLWGLDIDERATQLSYFAVMMKARQYDRRFLTRGIQPHVYAIEESNGITPAQMHDMGIGLSQDEYGKAVKEAMRLVEEMHDAKEYGSIIHVTPCDWDLLRRFAVPRGVSEGQMRLDIHGEIAASERLQKLINIGETLSQKYHAVITNPPYMGSGNMGETLSAYIKEIYPNTKVDLSTVFMEKNIEMGTDTGFISMINIPVWMTLAGCLKFREELIKQHTLINMLHNGRGVFGSDFGSTAFVYRKRHMPNYIGAYRRLFIKQGAVDTVEQKEKWFFERIGKFYVKQDNFLTVPGYAFAYNVDDAVYKHFEKDETVGNYASARQGLITGDNDRFMRFWFEVDRTHMSDNCDSRDDTLNNGIRWYPYNKGGDYRKWFGNNWYVVDWSNDGYDIRHFYNEKGKLRSRPQNMGFYFNEGLTWTALTAGKFSMRFSPKGYLFDAMGPVCFPKKLDDEYYILGFLNSCVGTMFLRILCPNLKFDQKPLENVPLVWANQEIVSRNVEQCIELAENDWNSSEISWNFKRHPFLDCYEGEKIEEASKKWNQILRDNRANMRSIEETINEMFISTYGLDGTIDPVIEDEDVTLQSIDEKRDVVDFISYAVGCMFGRYSLDVDGIVYAGGEWDESNYRRFLPDKDAIIPICDDEYFEDDIAGRFTEFVKTVYGTVYLEDNLQFIADRLGGKGTSREVIRNYFINDFFKDHCSKYSGTVGRRPIYWLFDSGKKNGFKCLVYMHRYQPDTIARIRTDYVHEQQSRYRTAIADLENRINGAGTSDRVRLNKQLTNLQAQATEIREYEEKIHHLADQMISIDLDDGVKHNYAIFKDVLAKIK